MTVDEIKSTYSMRDIVERYGFHPNRAGFISCPFHTGDRSPSLKVYPRDFHCHACGANGDIFTFVQKMENCDFKTAFYSLGGIYQKPTTSSKIAVYKAKKAKETRLKKEEKIRAKIQHNNLLLGVYVRWLKRLEPMSDAWCDCMNDYTKCLGRDEYLQNELGGGGRVGT